MGHTISSIVSVVWEFISLIDFEEAQVSAWWSAEHSLVLLLPNHTIFSFKYSDSRRSPERPVQSLLLLDSLSCKKLHTNAAPWDSINSIIDAFTDQSQRAAAEVSSTPHQTVIRYNSLFSKKKNIPCPKRDSVMGCVHSKSFLACSIVAISWVESSWLAKCLDIENRRDDLRQWVSA